MNTDPVRSLQLAARVAGRHVAPGIQIVRVVLIDVSGERVLAVNVPLGEASEGPTIDATPEPRPGWDFAGKVKFDGTTVPITGRKVAVLKLLAEARKPLTVDDLKAAWDGDEVSDENVRWTVGELRKLLLKEFPDWTGTDPIKGTKGEGYELMVK